MLLGPLWQLGVLHDDDDDGRCLGSRRWQLGSPGRSWACHGSWRSLTTMMTTTLGFQGRCWRRRAYGGDGPMAEDSPVTKVQDQDFPSSEGVRAAYLLWPWNALCLPS